MRETSVRSALSALALCAIAASAPATVLMFEPFSADSYSAGTVKGQMGNAAVTGNVGFTADRPWCATNTGVVFIHSEGLDFAKGKEMRGMGFSIGWNYKDNGNDQGSRGVFRQLADGVMPQSGTFYFRCLAKESTGAYWRGAWHRRVGFQQVGFDGDGGLNQQYYNRVFPSTGPHFVFQQTNDLNTTVLQFRYGNVVEPLVYPVAQGVTYLCLAKIEVQGLQNGHDRVSALAVPVGDWEWNGRDEPVWKFAAGDPGGSLATTEYFPDKFQLYGAYETHSVPVAFDEVMLATELSDAVPKTLLPTVVVVK